MNEIPSDILDAAETTFLVLGLHAETAKERAALVGGLARSLLMERNRTLNYVIAQTTKLDGTPCCHREDWKPKQREFFDQGQREANEYMAMVLRQILDRNLPLEG